MEPEGAFPGQPYSEPDKSSLCCNSLKHLNILLGVCILLRVRDQVMWVFIRLHNVTIVC
jgi:hypothetical protein